MPPILGGIKVETHCSFEGLPVNKTLRWVGNMLTPDFLLNKCRMFFGGAVLKRAYYGIPPKFDIDTIDWKEGFVSVC